MSVIRSATTANSEGHGDPPKGVLSEIMIYQISLNWTLTADLTYVSAFRCNRLNADFKSLFLSHIFVFGYFVRSATTM